MILLMLCFLQDSSETSIIVGDFLFKDGFRYALAEIPKEGKEGEDYFLMAGFVIRENVAVIEHEAHPNDQCPNRLTLCPYLREPGWAVDVEFYDGENTQHGYLIYNPDIPQFVFSYPFANREIVLLRTPLALVEKFGYRNETKEIFLGVEKEAYPAEYLVSGPSDTPMKGLHCLKFSVIENNANTHEKLRRMALAVASENGTKEIITKAN